MPLILEMLNPHTWIRKLRPGREDVLGRERGQALLRIFIGIGIYIFYYALNYRDEVFPGALRYTHVFFLTFIGISLVFAYLAYKDSQTNVNRRYAANLVDVVAATMLLIDWGEYGHPMFIIYLWVTLGNGFRYGVNPLVVSSILSLIGFTCALIFSTYWRMHPFAVGGVYAALILIPGYVGYLVHQLYKTRERAIRASAAKSEFLAKMSHELRTPLNGVLGSAELLQQSKNLNVNERSLLDIIIESVKSTTNDVSRILDYIKSESGRQVLYVEDFDLHTVVHNAQRSTIPAAREKNLRVTLSMAGPYLLHGDATKLHTALSNLISNAVKFTDTGHVNITIRPKRTSKDSALLLFEIADSGIGISEEALGKVWESFVQESSGTSRKYGGSGLGTTIAKQAVEQLGGVIGVTSTKGEGSTFWFEVPFLRQPNAEEREVNVQNGRILLLSHDDELIRHYQSYATRHASFLTVAKSINEASSLLSGSVRLDSRWQVLISDGNIAFSADGGHLAADLVRQANESQIATYLVESAQVDEKIIEDTGYTRAFPRLASDLDIATAVHASPLYRQPSTRGVIHLDPASRRPQAQNVRSAQILVVDDNRTNRMVTKQILETAGYSVEELSDSNDAVSYMLSGKYAAVVLDLHMPDMDGVTVIYEYRFSPQPKKKIPIIMLTADTTFETKQWCANEGVDIFLTKPVSSENLIQSIERLTRDSEVVTIGTFSSESNLPRETPIIDTVVFNDLTALYRGSSAIFELISTFDTETEHALRRLGECITLRNHSAFVDTLFSIRGNAVNMGVARLAERCKTLESIGVLEFRESGGAYVKELKELVSMSQKAMRELIRPRSVPADG